MQPRRDEADQETPPAWQRESRWAWIIFISACVVPFWEKKKKKKERKKNPKGVDISQAGLPDSGALLPPERGFHETVMLKDTPTRRDWLLGTEL